jgi:hypothetical protein
MKGLKANKKHLLDLFGGMYTPVHVKEAPEMHRVLTSLKQNPKEANPLAQKSSR